MGMPRLMLMPRYQYRHFQMADHQYLRKPDNDVFAFKVAFWCIPKRAELQINFGNLEGETLVNKQMLACNFIEKGLYSKRFA